MSLLRSLRAYVGLAPDDEYEDHAADRRPSRDDRTSRPSRARRSYLDDYYSESGRSTADDGDQSHRRRSQERGRIDGHGEGGDVELDPDLIDIRNARIDARLADGSPPPTRPRLQPRASAPSSTSTTGGRQRTLTENEELLDRIPETIEPVDEPGSAAPAVDDGLDRSASDDHRSPGAVVRSIDSARSRPRTLTPDSFSDAKQLADEFKRGSPLVINLQGLDRDLTRRLVDFASGVCYGLDGGMEKLAPQVFLLTPAGVDVSESDRRRIEERGYAR